MVEGKRSSCIILDQNQNISSAIKGTEEQKQLLGQTLPNRRVEDWKFFPADQFLGKWAEGIGSSSDRDSDLSIKEEEGAFILDIPYFLNEKEPQEIAKGLTVEVNSSKRIPSKLNDFHEPGYFSELNAGSDQKTLIISLEKGIVLEKPLKLSWILNPDFSGSLFPRVEIELSESSSMRMVESHQGFSQTVFICPQLQAQVAANAYLEYNSIQKFGPNVLWIQDQKVVQQGDSIFRSNQFFINGGRSRNNLEISLEGKGSEAYLNGVFMPKANDLIDNHTIVDHVAEHCFSDENYKGIIFDKGTGVFNGRIFVRPGAQKTRAFQSNKNILLGNNPVVHSKPQLEILADDVKCTHGATTGRLDEEQLFYLRSRGIGQEEAERMLTEAFAKEILEKVEIDFFREEVEQSLDQVFQDQ